MAKKTTHIRKRKSYAVPDVDAAVARLNSAPTLVKPLSKAAAAALSADCDVIGSEGPKTQRSPVSCRRIHCGSRSCARCEV